MFDKTGTLTEEGLSVLGFRSTARAESHVSFRNFTQDINDLTQEKKWWNNPNSDSRMQARNLNTTLMVEAMASCTAITYVNESLVGDPLDVQMFESTGWTLDESEQ